MQISALNMAQVKVDSISENVAASNGSSAFLNVFLATMQSSNNVNIKGSEMVPETIKEGNADLKDLLAFLDIKDITEIEGGLELLDHVISSSDSDLLGMIKNYLGISDNKWDEMIKAVTGEAGNQSLPLEIQDTQEKQEEQVLILITNLLSMQPKEFIKLSAQDVQTAVKAVKLYQLMADHKDTSSKGSIKLNGLMNFLTEKLEMLLPVNKPNNDFLQKSFTHLAAELNLNKPKENEKSTIFQKFEAHNPITFLSGETAKMDQITGLQLTPQTLARTEQLTLLDANRKPVSTDELMRQFESIIAKSSFSRNDGLQRLFIKLNPEHLGSLRIELIQKEQGLIARIMTTNSHAKETLDSHLQSLKQAFASQNLSVERIDISQQIPQQERFMNRDHHQQQHSNRDSRNEEQEQKSDGDFTSSFEEALLNLEV